MPSCTACLVCQIDSLTHSALTLIVAALLLGLTAARPGLLYASQGRCQAAVGDSFMGVTIIAASSGSSVCAITIAGASPTTYVPGMHLHVSVVPPLT